MGNHEGLSHKNSSEKLLGDQKRSLNVIEREAKRITEEKQRFKEIFRECSEAASTLHYDKHYTGENIEKTAGEIVTIDAWIEKNKQHLPQGVASYITKRAAFFDQSLKMDRYMGDLRSKAASGVNVTISNEVISPFKDAFVSFVEEIANRLQSPQDHSSSPSSSGSRISL
ncbi:MAG TPA: hypothetical protein VGL94_23740 [Ktedonobacteraceae bacterium]|jgi:hypothetical protein